MKEISGLSLFSTGVGRETREAINKGEFSLKMHTLKLIKDNIEFQKQYYLRQRVNQGTYTLFLDGVCLIDSLCDISSFFHLSGTNIQVINTDGELVRSFNVLNDTELAFEFIKNYIERYINSNVIVYYINACGEKIYPALIEKSA